MKNLFLTAAAPKGGMLGAFMPLVLMMVLFYIMMYIPEKKRKKKYNEMLNSLNLNDEVITKGGILGKIVNIQDTFIIIETGPNRARIKLDKNGILSVLQSSSAEESTEKEDKKDEEKKEVEYKEN